MIWGLMLGVGAPRVQGAVRRTSKPGRLSKETGRGYQTLCAVVRERQEKNTVFKRTVHANMLFMQPC